MLRFSVIALAGAISAVGAAEAVTAVAPQIKAAEMLRRDQVAAQAPADPSAPAPEPTATAASITKASDGHFWAEAEVNGSRVRFLVDTGATAVALTQADAVRLGIEPRELTYSYKVMTANGPARAAAVKLASVSVAGARVANVDALVIEDGLDTSLLGMTYLGRLSRFEATPSSLILRP